MIGCQECNYEEESSHRCDGVGEDPIYLCVASSPNFHEIADIKSSTAVGSIRQEGNEFEPLQIIGIEVAELFDIVILLVGISEVVNKGGSWLHLVRSCDVEKLVFSLLHLFSAHLPITKWLTVVVVGFEF